MHFVVEHHGAFNVSFMSISLNVLFRNIVTLCLLFVEFSINYIFLCLFMQFMLEIKQFLSLPYGLSVTSSC